MNAQMSLNFGQIQPLITELSAIEGLNNQRIMLQPLYGLHF